MIAGTWSRRTERSSSRTRFWTRFRVRQGTDDLWWESSTGSSQPSRTLSLGILCPETTSTSFSDRLFSNDIEKYKKVLLALNFMIWEGRKIEKLHFRFLAILKRLPGPSVGLSVPQFLVGRESDECSWMQWVPIVSYFMIYENLLHGYFYFKTWILQTLFRLLPCPPRATIHCGNPGNILSIWRSSTWPICSQPKTRTTSLLGGIISIAVRMSVSFSSI